MDEPQLDSPVNKLPPELLCKVFLYCASPDSSPQEDDLGDSWETENGNDASIIPLTHVSKYWKLAALGSPELWSKIWIKEGVPLSKTAEWLRRSSSYPLDITINQSSFGFVQEAVKLLIPHSLRWRRFRLQENVDARYGSQALYLRPIFYEVANPDLVTISLPKLEVLQLCDHAALYDTSASRFIHLNTPALRILQMKDIRHDWNHFRMDLGHITHFQLSESDPNKPYVRDLIRIIGQMGALQLLDLTIDEALDDSLVPLVDGHTMILPSLKTLCLTLTGSCPELWTWLTNLDAAELHSMQVVQFCPEDTDADVRWHSQVQERGWIPLQKAIKFPSLREVKWQPGEERSCGGCFVPFISAIPTISRLTVVEPWRLRYPLIPLFSFTNCAQLQRVDIYSPSNPPDFGSEVTKMIRRVSPKAHIFLNDVLISDGNH
ncbi:hypothetical protein FRC03_008645 [Tulasnella sp. 419]|nr:hypothetical protein FRC03_008645 [Tulasnella sp. 419]